ncbi:metalloregulator ArsR/SmtB family transcription factor [Bdellovibrio sp. SKB1291214]|uniref:ArsR/SmtB family transcription factor n=1 Tax=Bdellovibrio sp. SKB1291214 TaxID=1732569 RepID=UPI000B51BEE3|nr:metalloregulator ArsR/SmtB family transcription factor [Bdellovibrio sp. SKB1291214]UYL09896.1 metalloregulator ArsR/SmtB family transcription factor [Bdellovibrio sp. SKB1291214]
MHSINIEPTALLQAIADKTRLRILRILVSLPKEEACLCDLTDSLQEPEYNVSRHLKVLRNAGLLSSRKDGRWVYQSLSSEKSVKPFYRLIAEIPDLDQTFAKDLKRFKNELAKRSNKLCTKDGSDFERQAPRSPRKVTV